MSTLVSLKRRDERRWEGRCAGTAVSQLYYTSTDFRYLLHEKGLYCGFICQSNLNNGYVNSRREVIIVPTNSH